MRISLNSLGRLIGALLLLCCAACGPHHLPDPLTPEEHLDLGKAYEARGETERAQGQYTAAAVTVPEGGFLPGQPGRRYRAGRRCAGVLPQSPAGYAR